MNLRPLASLSLLAGFLAALCPLVHAAAPAAPGAAPKTPPAASATPPSTSLRGSFRSVLRPQLEIPLPSLAAGVVTVIHVPEGSIVKKGDPIISLDSEIEKAEVAQAEAALRGAQAEAERASAEFKRFDQLHVAETITIADKDWLNAKAQAARAAAQSDQAAAILQGARVKLSYRTLSSPIDGIFLKTSKVVGEAVERYEPVARIVDVTSLEMTVFCDGTYISRFRTGQRVEMRVFKSAEDQPIISGIIVHTDPIIDPAYGTFRIKIKINPSPNAIPGLQAFLISPG